jgi:hypothetical protein
MKCDFLVSKFVLLPNEWINLCCYSMVLYPVNEERKFMIRSVIHNCFEMPYPNTNVEVGLYTLYKATRCTSYNLIQLTRSF